MKHIVAAGMIAIILVTGTIQSVSAKRIITPTGEIIDLSFLKSDTTLIQDIRSFEVTPPSETDATYQADLLQYATSEETTQTIAEPDTEIRETAKPVKRAPSQPVLQPTPQPVPVANPVVQLPAPPQTITQLPASPAPQTTVAPPEAAPIPAYSAPTLTGPLVSATFGKPIDGYNLSIPKLGLTNVAIVPSDLSNEKTWKDALTYGVAQALYLPGTGHKTLIFGHSSKYSWDTKSKVVFRELNKLVAGDSFTIAYNGKQYVYEVYKKEIVKPDTPSIMTDYGWDEAVLFTCWPIGSYRQRLVVFSKLVSS